VRRPAEFAVRSVLAELRRRLPQAASARALSAAAAEARAAAAASGAGEARRVAVTTLLAEALAWNAVRFQAQPPVDVVDTAARAADLDPAVLR
jgi:hypothetical protein